MKRLRRGIVACLAALFAWSLLRWTAAAGLLLSATGGSVGAASFVLLTARPLFWAAASLLVLALAAVRWSDPRTAGRWAAVAFAALAAALALIPRDASTRADALGLASGPPGATVVEDFSGRANKDAYPVCRFEYDSLGFRDAEPSFAPKGRRRRVLLVGDSFVWGDGIATNAETLGARLRAELERRAPGRYEVLSAAHPGLGLYGYARFVSTLAPRWEPDAVVIGWLGESERDPFDPQFLLDHLPSRRLLLNLVLNAGAAQELHEASVRRSRLLWPRPEFASGTDALLGSLAAAAAAGRYRLLFLAYGRHRALPPGVEVLELPPALLYEGRSSDLWYAKDYHPKPALNERLAVLLAGRLLGR